MKTSKKLISETLKSLNVTEIHKIAKRNGVDVSNLIALNDWIIMNAPTKKVLKQAYKLSFGRNFNKSINSQLPFNDILRAIQFAKEQEKGNYLKILIAGNNNYYWASSTYGHSDFNKSIAFPITQKTKHIAEKINSILR